MSWCVTHRCRPAAGRGRGRASWSWWSVAPALLVGLLLGACGGGDPELPGTNLDKPPAPDFRLADQTGQNIALSDLRGRAVVLTFLYSTCPDFCPLTAEKLRQTYERLGRDAAKVAMLAVSVDPERDDRQAVQAFSAAHRMPEPGWHYLIGDETQLAPVWQAYGIGRLPRGAAAAATPGAAAADLLGHTEALYLIDPQGRERTLLRGDFQPEVLADALKQLVK